MDDHLLSNAAEALAAIEMRLEELYPGITEDEDVYPGLEKGGAGMALLFHALRTGCDFDKAAKHLKQHCEELERLQEDYQMAREEPLRLSLEEIELAGLNYFPPPQVASNTLLYAIGRWKEGFDKWPGENGGIKLADGRERQRQRTKRRKQALAKCFADLHQAEPDQFPISKLGFARASAVLEEGGDVVKPSTIEKAFLGSVHHKLLDWPAS